MNRESSEQIERERDYWNRRKMALEHLSIEELEDAIRFGQQNNIAEARFDLTLEVVLRSVYIKNSSDEKKEHIREIEGCNLAKDEVYLFLEYLFRRGDFYAFYSELFGRRYSEYYKEPRVHDSPLFLVAIQGDRKMLAFLLKHVDHDAPYNQGLYDAVLQHYLFMKLPDWGNLANVSGSQEELRDSVEKQADSLCVKRSPVLRMLLEADFPSKYEKLPLDYSDVHIVSIPGKGYRFIENGTDWTASPRGNGSSGYAHNDADMVRALSESGSFYPFTCECGIEECAGLWEPIQCLNTESGMRWYKPYPLPMSFIVFSPKPVLVELERALTAIDERVKPEWSSKPESEYGFPHAPFGTTYSSFEEALAFCRKRLKEIKVDKEQ